MTRIGRCALVLLILVACVGCDRATKNVARESLADSAPVSLANDMVRFEYTENPGAFLGLGSGWSPELRFLLLVVLAGTSLLLALALMLRARGSGLGLLVGVSLVAGGGVGNLLDRLFNDGAVIDFVRLGVGSLRTGVFNLADVAIMVGVALLLASSAREMKGARDAP